MEKAYEVSPGIFFPVSGYARIIDENKQSTGETIPIVDIPMMSDYQWQLNCLKSRMEHPELYEATEDVQKTTEQLQQWLLVHSVESGVVA